MSSAEVLLQNVKVSTVEKVLKEVLPRIGLTIVDEERLPTGFSLLAIEGKRVPLWTVNIVSLFGPVLLRNRIGVVIDAIELSDKRTSVTIKIKYYMAELDLEAPKVDKKDSLRVNRLLEFLRSTISEISEEKEGIKEGIH